MLQLITLSNVNLPENFFGFKNPAMITLPPTKIIYALRNSFLNTCKLLSECDYVKARFKNVTGCRFAKRN